MSWYFQGPRGIIYFSVRRNNEIFFIPVLSKNIILWVFFFYVGRDRESHNVVLKVPGTK